MTQRARRLLFGLGTGAVVALLLLLLHGSYASQALELKTLDLRFRTLHDPARADTSVVIVDVDQLSLDLLRPSVGRFPWPRSVWAMVVQYLAAGGARVIAFDFTFPDPVLGDTAGDAAFAAATAQAGTVVQTLALQQNRDTAEVRRLAAFREDSAALALLPRFALPVEGAPEGYNRFEIAEHPFRGLLEAARALGVINYTPDPVDGTARRTPVVFQYRGQAWPAFGLATAIAADSSLSCGRPAAWSADALELCGTRLPLEDGALLINWKGPYRNPADTAHGETYRVIPVARLINSYLQLRTGAEPEVPLAELQGKVVLVGASGSGLFEARANPFGPADPGVLIHATVADNILRRDFLRRARPLTNAALILIAALLTGLAVSSFARVWPSALTSTLLAAVLTGGAFVLFQRGLWIDLASPFLAVLLTFTGGMAVNYFTEGRHKRQIRDMFSKYVAPEYVDQLAADPSKLHLEGRRAELSILFSDIRGFTTISESMSPTEVIGFLNIYLTDMAAIVKRSGGTLDKFIGDAVMAFWGEPVRVADHADRACDCALEMKTATEALAERFAAEGKPPIRIGIGINTADVVVGNIGSLEHKLDYTVIGDGVNLASRLEGSNKDYGTTIIISEFTLAKVGDRFSVRELGDVKVKGKTKPVKVYELLGRVGSRKLEVGRKAP